MLDAYPETLVNIEWHNSGFTPSNSDFDIPEYSSRASMYGVGGIPHTQWNGVQETVGGYPDGNWQAIIGTFEALYASMVGDDTPYEIDINGYVGEQVSYDVTVSMDTDMSNSNQKVDIFVVEDNIWSYWSGASSYHNARNVARDWLVTENVSISSAGESETFSGSFDLDEDWNADSVKIIALVQNYSTKQIYQVSQVNINDMNPDIDDDGVLNAEDNCIDIFNPGQEDSDGDLIGDVCDPCDNLVYVMGNISGDTDSSGEPVIDLMDVLTLVDYLLLGDSNECQDTVMNINGDGFINVVDVITLVQSIMNGNN
jgi:hypothetical protein